MPCLVHYGSRDVGVPSRDGVPVHNALHLADDEASGVVCSHGLHTVRARHQPAAGASDEA